jgi:drug/metabolite transporter (DMT)-like permease
MSQASASTLNSRRDRWLVWAALFSLYLIWGSTYLGIRFAVETIPPMLMTSGRFLISGLIMYAFLRFHGAQNPTPRQFWNAGLVGVFLICGGNGFVTVAEHTGVASGIAATAVASVSIWTGLWSGLWGQWPRKLEWLGVAVGFVGVVILTLEGNLRTNPIGLIVFCAPICWSFGSILSRNIDMPQGLMASAIEMIVAGVVSAPIGLLLGERITQMPSTSSLLAAGYLITFGSLIGFNAYIYVLGKVRPTLATSYAYVNPVVALFLGVAIGGEKLGANAIIALPIILLGVAVIAWAQNAPRTLRYTKPDQETEAA